MTDNLETTTKKESRDVNLNVLAGLLCLFSSSYFLGFGISYISEYYNGIAAIKSAIYSRATEITPEIISQATETAYKLTTSNHSLFYGVSLIMGAGLIAGFGFYNLSRAALHDVPLENKKKEEAK